MSLFAFGSNGSGQLSLSHREDVSVPTKCVLSSQQEPPCFITAGGNHTLILFPHGELYAVGLNSSLQCCHPRPTDFIETFTLIPSPNTQHFSFTGGWGLCAAGWEFSIFVSEDLHRVYSSGSGPKGELGLGLNLTSTAAFSQLPTLIPDFPPPGTSIVAISASLDHVVAVLSTGEAYGWGNARKGQLGESALAIVWSPTKIEGIQFPIARAVCGREFTFLIDDSGSHHVVLGGKKWGLKTNAPLSATEDGRSELEGYTYVGASWSGIYVLLKNGSIKAWGRDDRGQLPPKDLPPVRRLAAGSEHVVAVTSAGSNEREKLVAWGWGEHGNCGSADPRTGKGKDIVDIVHYIDISSQADTNERGNNKRICMVGAGCATSWVWME